MKETTKMNNDSAPAEAAAHTIQTPAPPPEHIMQFFAYAHLPPHLQAISRPFAELAFSIAVNVPRNPERTVAFRKLLESKDAAVRARLAK